MTPIRQDEDPMGVSQVVLPDVPRYQTFKIQRTRLITEVFRVEAITEDEAVDMLSDCDTVICGYGVEQVELSTLQSEIEVHA